MSKLIIALVLAATAVTANATPFTDDETTELCSTITDDPIMRAQVKVFVAAVNSGMGEQEAENFAADLTQMRHMGSTFPVKLPVFSDYIDKLDGIKDFDSAIAHITKQCKNHLHTLK